MTLTTTRTRLQAYLDTRVQALAGEICQLGAVAMILSRPEHAYYLTGTTSARTVLVTADGECLVNDDVERVAPTFEGLVLVEPEHLTVASQGRLLTPGRARPVDGSSVIERLRAVKDDLEVAVLRRAAQISAAAMEEARALVRPGVTELEIESAMWRSIRTNGAEGWAYDPSIASGPRAARPWNGVSLRSLEPGDLVVIDAGAKYRCYRADLTRTFIVPGLGSERSVPQQQALDAVRRARDAALAVVRPGCVASQVTAAVARSLAADGFPASMPHAAGHGLGLDLHERPSLTRRSTEILLPGNVLTIEPGIYRQGWGGARLEDTVVVTDDGWSAISPLES